MGDLASAAAAMGLPEGLVERSAAARAAETGQSVDDLYTQWAGGEAAPAPEPPPTATVPEESHPEPASEDSAREEAVAPEIVIDIPIETTTPKTVAAGPYKPPILVGEKDNPMAVLAGVVGLFVIVIMVGLVGPSLPVDTPGARTTNLPYSEAALDGQHVYATSGCAACHTQMVRPVVADVGLGPVSLDDSNQVLGVTRFGPDLSDVGSRITPAQIETVVAGLGEHPSQNLSDTDMSTLVAYLAESNTSGGGGS